MPDQRPDSQCDKAKNNRGPAETRKRILLIAYHFPPSPAVGGLRMFNLAKHLPAHGWDVDVLTIQERYLRERDHSRLDELQGVDIFRTRLLPTALALYLRLKSVFRSLATGRRITPDELRQAYVPARVAPGRKSWSTIASNHLISVLLALPDTERNWILPAVLKAVKLLRQRRYDFILTSCPPYSVHLIGLLLKKATGAHWIADFRDPWLLGSRKALFVTTGLSNRIERRLEEAVLRNADIVMTTTQRLANLYAPYADGSRGRSCLAQANGYDEQLFAAMRTGEKYEHFTITYTGSLYFGRTPEPVFKAVAALIASAEISVDRIRIKLVGQCEFIDDRPVAAVAASYGLGDVVEVCSAVPYERSIEILHKSHLALLLAPGQPLQIPAKAFEYIGAGTPILAITGEGATRDLVEGTGTGGAFGADDIDAIKGFLRHAIKTGARGSTTIPDAIMRQFTTATLAANVAERLNRYAAGAIQDSANL